MLADWNLPDDSGLSLLRRIRQHDGDTPLVMITGRSDRESVLAVRPLVEPALPSVLCLAASSRQRPTPLIRHVTQLLTDLVRRLPQATAAPSLPG